MEEQEKYGKEPKYKIGQRVKFIIANYKASHIGWIYAYYENGNYRVIEDGVTPSGGFNSFVIPEEDITPIVEDYEVSYIAEKPKQSLSKQEGGSHYKDFAIQPVEFCFRNNIPAIESSIIRYATRHRQKNKDLDVRKIIHYCKILLQLEYGYTDEQIAEL